MPSDEPYGALEARTAISIHLPSLSVYFAVLEESIRLVLLMRMKKSIDKGSKAEGAQGQRPNDQGAERGCTADLYFCAKSQEAQREDKRGSSQVDNGQTERMLVEKLLFGFEDYRVFEV